MLDHLQKTLGYRFRDLAWLQLALTHSSARHELNLPDDNQRLEFLGDAVLGLLTADYGYHAHSERDEGVLTILRSSAASSPALAHIARTIGLGDYLILGKGEDASGGRGKEKNLADALEALIGASYLDGGLEGARRVFQHLFVPAMEQPAPAEGPANPKGELQEWAQARGLACPEYEVIKTEGPSHQPVFQVEVRLEPNAIASGAGPSKKIAEMEAARLLLAQLTNQSG